MQSSNSLRGGQPAGTHSRKSYSRSVHPPDFRRGLNLFDSITLVVGAMIGSGIFIVPPEMARDIGSPGWLLGAWVVAGALTIAGALCYGELSGMMPRAGEMYVYLREAYSPLWGFLYGWTLFSVIETGTIAAVACARLTGVLWPSIADDKYFVALIHVAGVFRLRVRQPETRRPYRTPGYPVVPSLYILVATAIVVILFAYRPSTT
jgi:amino acid transporter